MSNVAIFKAGESPKYLLSVNTPDYEKDPDVLVNPDISAVKGIPLEHWARDGDKIVEMASEDKAVLFAEKAIVEDNRITALNITALELTKGLIACGVITEKDLTYSIRTLE